MALVDSTVDKLTSIMNPRVLENKPGLRLLFRVAAGAGAGMAVGGALGGISAADQTRKWNDVWWTGDVPYSKTIPLGAKTGAVAGAIPGALAGYLYDMATERQRLQNTADSIDDKLTKPSA
jgi:hypothetical protein